VLLGRTAEAFPYIDSFGLIELYAGDSEYSTNPTVASLVVHLMVADVLPMGPTVGFKTKVGATTSLAGVEVGVSW
jgi:hypothetical protein